MNDYGKKYKCNNYMRIGCRRSCQRRWNTPPASSRSGSCRRKLSKKMQKYRNIKACTKQNAGTKHKQAGSMTKSQTPGKPTASSSSITTSTPLPPSRLKLHMSGATSLSAALKANLDAPNQYKIRIVSCNFPVCRWKDLGHQNHLSHYRLKHGKRPG